MTEKSEIVPEGKRLGFGVTVNFFRYRDWEKPEGFSHDGSHDDGSVTIPSFVDLQILTEADKSDPLNQLRVYCLRIGKRLAYKMTFTAELENDPRVDLQKIAAMALFLIGVDCRSEIRDAIAEEWAAWKAGGPQ